MRDNNLEPKTKPKNLAKMIARAKRITLKSKTTSGSSKKQKTRKKERQAKPKKKKKSNMEPYSFGRANSCAAGCS